MEASGEAVCGNMETDVHDEKDLSDDHEDAETSSDESDEDNDAEQDDSIEKIQVLEKELEACPYYYDKHVELIQLLKKVKLASKLRSARQLMSKHFPLTEELWLEWLEDEEGDDEFTLELLNRAVQDYQSVKLWLELACHQMRVSNNSTNNNPSTTTNNNPPSTTNNNPPSTNPTTTVGEGARAVREVFERALSHCALHCTEAPLLWDAYRDYEMIAPYGENGDEERYNKILSLLTRQLSCPLIGLNTTYSKYKEIVGGEVDEVVQGHFQRSTTLLNKLIPFENTLKGDTSIDAYNKYIQHVINNTSDPSLVVCLYERAIKVHCLQAPLWTSYLTYLTKNLRIASVVLPVCRRAVRNCPWSLELWLLFLRALEWFKETQDTVKATFTEALTVGFSQGIEYLSLWTAYIDYLRRRVPWQSPDKQPEVDCLREAFDNANKQLMQTFSHDGDPNATLLQYQAFIEAKYLGGIGRARELYSAAMKYPLVRKQHLAWMQYVQLERCYGDVKSARKVFQMALNSVHEGLLWVLEEFVRFEREEGDLESYEKALEKYEVHVKKVQERKSKDAVKESKRKQGHQGEQRDVKGASKPDKKSSNKGKNAKKQLDKAPGKPSVSTKQPQLLSKERASNGSMDRKGAVSVEAIKPYQKKRPLMFDRSDSEAHPVAEQKTQNDGFKVPLAPPPGFAEQSKKIMMKRNKPDDDDDGGDGDVATVTKKYKSMQSDFTTTTTATSTTATLPPTPQPSHSDLCTVFVSNLDYSISKEDIAEALTEAGTVKEVRLVTNHKGMSKGFAYVEFDKQESVEKAFQLDRKSVQGRPMFVSKFKKAGKSGASDVSKFKFGDSLEKNKLFVKNLSADVTKEDLQKLFQTVGEVKEVRLATYRNGHSKGHAYVEFIKEESAAQAVLKLDEYELKGQSISVAISNPPARNQKAASRDVAMETTHAPSLGGGKKVMGRKSQLSMLPRNVQVPTSNTACLSNQDFRQMLLHKK